MRWMHNAPRENYFGGGLLLSDRAAAERAAAVKWELSARERAIVEYLNSHETD